MPRQITIKCRAYCITTECTWVARQYHATEADAITDGKRHEAENHRHHTEVAVEETRKRIVKVR